MEIRVFLRGEQNTIRADEARREAVAKRMGATAASLSQGSTAPDFIFPVLGTQVTFYGERWGEKWVEHIGDHLHLYAAGSMLYPAGTTPLLQTGSVAAAVGDWRRQKSLSGDVTGAIGETLFALLLRQRFGQRSRSFAHLRAVKVMGFPDFEIIRPTRALSDAFRPVIGRSFGSHLPAEAKSIALADDGTISERAFKALGQINSYWTERDRKDGTPKRDPDGIIALFVRNVSIRAYDAVLYGVT